MFCHVRGYGGRRVRRITAWPTSLTPFPFLPVHAYLVYCLPACVWSVTGQVAAAAAVWLVCGGLGRLIFCFVSGSSVVLLLDVFCVAGWFPSAPVSRVLGGPMAAQCSVFMLVGRLCTRRVVVFCRVRAHGGRRVWRTMVWPTRFTPFLFQPMHAWLVWCWQAPLWSVYGQIAAAAAVWLMRGGLGRSMVGLVSVDSVALLPDLVCVAGSLLLALVSRVLIRPIAVYCSVVMVVGRLRIGTIAVCCCACGFGVLWAWRITVWLMRPIRLGSPCVSLAA